MPLWPSVLLPNPDISFNGEVSGSTVRTPMDSGRVRQRSRFTRKYRSYDAQWTLSEFEFGIFQSFVAHKLTNGADAFDIELPVGAGDEMQEVSAKIVEGKYSHKYDGVMYWKVGCTLEVDTITIYTEEELDALIAAGEAGLPPPSTQAFTVDLIEGEATKAVTFPVSFGLLGAPPGLYVALLIPPDGYTFEVAVVEVTITATGFTVMFGAAIPGPGYSLSVIASFTI